MRKRRCMEIRAKTRARARCKTCPFICNVEKMSDPSDPSRSLIILPAPQLMSSTALLALFVKSYRSAKQRRLGDRFREHLRDVEKGGKNASQSVARHIISPIILSNIWQSAASPYIKVALKAVKL